MEEKKKFQKGEGVPPRKASGSRASRATLRSGSPKKAEPSPSARSRVGAQAERALRQSIAALGPISDEQRNAVVCSLVGHSRIQTFCFGYFNCARCGHQVGDSLASIYYGAETCVIVGHDCDKCRKNAETLTWKDTLFTPNPFPALAARSGEPKAKSRASRTERKRATKGSGASRATPN